MKKYLFRTVELVSVSILAFIVLNTFSENFAVNIFQLRDLERASLLLEGKLILFGPETTGGGNLPGPYYYFLIAIPLLITKSIQAVWYWNIILTATSFATLWLYFRTRFNFLAATTILMALFSSAIIYLNLTSFMNPSFLPIFVAIATILAFEIFVFERRETKVHQYWVLLNLTSSIALSIHFTMVFFLFAVWLMAWQVHGTKKSFFLKGLTSLLVPLLPFFIWLLVGTHKTNFLQEAPPFSGNFYKSSSFITNLAFDSSKMIQETGLESYTKKSSNSNSLLRVNSPIIVFVFLLAISLFLKRTGKLRWTSTDKNLLKLSGTLSLFTLLPAAVIFTYPPGYRWGEVIAIQFPILIGLLAADAMKV